MVSKGAFLNVIEDFQQHVNEYHQIPLSIKNSTKSSIMKPFVAAETPIKPARDSFGPPPKLPPTTQKKPTSKPPQPGEKKSASKKKSEKKKPKPTKQLATSQLSDRLANQKAAKPPTKKKT